MPIAGGKIFDDKKVINMAETTNWIEIGPVVGDTGATGPKGDKGDTGATGSQGPAGPLQGQKEIQVILVLELQ